MDIISLYSRFLEAGTVSTDTRSLLPGCMFFALKGPRFNANKLVPEALKKGARWAVMDDAEYATDDRCIVVDSAQVELEKLARHHRDQFQFPVFGLTGSNGKTTTKELLLSGLSGQMQIRATKGNLNNHIGVPLTLLGTPLACDLLIVEMGTNQPGDIRHLCEIADPDMGMITNIGDTHLEKLRNQAGVFKDKRHVFDHVAAKKGVYFKNTDDQWLKTLTNSDAQIIEYNKEGSGALVLNRIPGREGSLSCQLFTESNTCRINTHLVGGYNMQNIAAVIAVAHHFKLDLAQVCLGLEAYRPSNMRSQHMDTGSNEVIMDGYNANPSSMAASLNDFLTVDYGTKRRVVILGDMLELGAKSHQFHKDIVTLLAEQPQVDVYLVGPLFAAVNSTFHSFEHVNDLINYLESHPIENATVLIKGSRGIALEKVIDKL